MHRNACRSIDAQANLVATNVNNDDLNIVTDHDGFFAVSRENEHGGLPWLAMWTDDPSAVRSECSLQALCATALPGSRTNSWRVLQVRSLSTN